MIRKFLIFLILLNHQVSGQEENVLIDSSGVIIVKNLEGKYLDLKNWSCIITTKEKSFESNKLLKKTQDNLIFLYPFDFDTELDSTKNYTVLIKKEDKIIFEEKVFFEFKPKGKYQLLSNQKNSKLIQKIVRGEIIDSYYFESETNKHEIIRSVYNEKRINFYHFMDDKIINIHTDFFDYNSLNQLKNPILITDLNDDHSPEITLKYTTKTKSKIVFFNNENKFICRKEKEEITFSPSLNEFENCFFKQYLINEINSISE